MSVPNVLSVFRLILVPVFVIVYFCGGENANIYSVLVYSVAGLSDILDGKIARKYHLESKLGKILDPLGDKLMAFAVLLCITISKVVPLWALIVFFVKEALMAIGGLLIFKRADDMPASNAFGKCATAVFFVVCALLLVFKNIPELTAVIMISVAVAVMLLAFFSYTVRFIGFMKSEKRTSK